MIWRWRKDGKAEEGRSTGTLAAGKYVGHDVYVDTDGNRFEVDDNGRGTWIWANGNRYEGEFRDGKLTGRGVFTWADGTRFEGRFLDGEPVGAGTCAADGRTGRCLIENNEVRWLH